MKRTQTSLGLSDDALQHLHILLQVNLDCNAGFTKAVESASTADVKAIAKESARRHSKQAEALQQVLRSDFSDTDIANCVTLARKQSQAESESVRPNYEVNAFDDLEKLDLYVRDRYVTALGHIRGRAIRQMLHEHMKAAEVAEHLNKELLKQLHQT